MHAGEDIASCKDLFDTKKEIYDKLVSYHATDWDQDVAIETMSLDDLLDYGQWKILEIAYSCPVCHEGEVEAKEWLGTKLYVCDACPFLALERWKEGDVANLQDYLRFNS